MLLIHNFHPPASDQRLNKSYDNLIMKTIGKILMYKQFLLIKNFDCLYFYNYTHYRQS